MSAPNVPYDYPNSHNWTMHPVQPPVQLDAPITGTGYIFQTTTLARSNDPSQPPFPVTVSCVSNWFGALYAEAKVELPRLPTIITGSLLADLRSDIVWVRLNNDLDESAARWVSEIQDDLEKGTLKPGDSCLKSKSNRFVVFRTLRCMQFTTMFPTLDGTRNGSLSILAAAEYHMMRDCEAEGPWKYLWQRLVALCNRYDALCLSWITQHGLVHGRPRSANVRGSRKDGASGQTTSGGRTRKRKASTDSDKTLVAKRQLGSEDTRGEEEGEKGQVDPEVAAFLQQSEASGAEAAWEETKREMEGEQGTNMETAASTIPFFSFSDSSSAANETTQGATGGAPLQIVQHSTTPSNHGSGSSTTYAEAGNSAGMPSGEITPIDDVFSKEDWEHLAEVSKERQRESEGSAALRELEEIFNSLI